jgi:hypothetical protein
MRAGGQLRSSLPAGSPDPAARAKMLVDGTGKELLDALEEGLFARLMAALL